MLHVNIYCLPAFQVFLFVNVNTEFKVGGIGFAGKMSYRIEAVGA